MNCNHQYPNDNDYLEKKIIKVVESGVHFEVTMDDGWEVVIKKEDGDKPKEGNKIRLYPKGIGQSIRGVFIDEVKYFYRTKGEEREYRNIQMYGKDAKEWLERWDKGDTVWSIEMGGIGPGYEQAIQITVAEVLRFFYLKKYNSKSFQDKDAWKKVLEEIEGVIDVPEVKKLGLSGAQWDAAIHLALKIYKEGPCKIFKDERVKDRRIQVSKKFPG